MYQKTVLISVIFIVFLTSTLFPVSTIKLSGVRPPFFILKILNDEIKVDNNRVIYSENGNKISEYELLESSGTESLCRCKEFSAEIDNNCYVKVMTDVFPLLKEGKRERVPIKKIIKIRGIAFNHQQNRLFITGNPVPLSIVPELSIQGLENFIKKMENEYKKKCRVDLLSPDEINRCINIEKAGILLGEKDGNPVLIFYSGSGRRENPVSEKILARLKYEVFLPLKLILL